LGNYKGSFNWTSTGAYDAEIKQADSEYGPLFDKYLKVDVATLSKDTQANAMGQRLFLTYCSQCHGSDAGGAKGFPNLRDKDWLYGGDPATIEMTLLNGRNGVMPALGAAIGGEPGIVELANYVRSLSGLKHDAKSAAAGKAKFAICAACHGVDGKGNTALGAPNLTDAVWLYGSSEETIAEGIRNGRNNMMPAQKERLGEAKIHLLAAYVYSLGGGMPAPAPVASAPVANSEAPPAAAPPK
jgi:cytochrome c oxidase cbb3-type subunit 3